MSDQPGGWTPPQQPDPSGQGSGTPQQGLPSYGQATPGQGAPGYGAQGYGAQPGYGQYPGYGAQPTGTKDPEDLTLPLYGASFPQAVSRLFRSYARFTGRASRSEYWWTYLFMGIVQVIVGVLLVVALFVMLGSATWTTSTSMYGGTTSHMVTPPSGASITLLVIVGIVWVLVWAATIVPWIALGWRRMHDANFAGPMWLLSLIPQVGGIIVIILAAMPSKAEGMRFDPPQAALPPKA